MHLELVPSLRCPVPHATGNSDSWLVAAVDRALDRTIIDGTLGCPICGAEFPIQGGVTRMTTPADEHEQGATYPYTVDAMRLAALLALDDASKLVALVGHDVSDTEALQALTSVRCLAINPPRERAVVAGVAPAGVVVSPTSIPVAHAHLHAISLGPGAAHLTVAAAERLRAGGRLLAPVRALLPPALRLLARDATHWVAERAAVPSSPVPLTRAPSPLD